MTFDLKSLKPGDEVGIEIRRTNRVTQEICVSQSVGIVAEVADDGHIRLEVDEWYSPSGEYLIKAWGERRLAAPTDEGRLAVLQETIYEDLCRLQDKARSLPLDRLRELRETVLGLLAETGRDRESGCGPPKASPAWPVVIGQARARSGNVFAVGGKHAVENFDGV